MATNEEPQTNETVSGLVGRTSHYILLDKNNVSDFFMCCAVLCLFAQLYLTLCDPMDSSPPGSSAHAGSPGKNTGVGCYVLLQGIFLTQGSNPGLPHCRWILYHLSHQGTPRILEWVSYPFSREASQPRNQTRVSCIAGGFFTIPVTKKFKFDQYLFVSHHYKIVFLSKPLLQLKERSFL